MIEPLTTLPPAVARAYRLYAERHHGDLSDTLNFGETMFNAGGRAAIEAMVSFGDVLPRLSHIERRIQAIKALLATMGGGEP